LGSQLDFFEPALALAASLHAYGVEGDKAVAVLKAGVLEVTVPKSTQAKGNPVKIEVM
jgi:HSP20 family molecular chaperone IbpA